MTDNNFRSTVLHRLTLGGAGPGLGALTGLGSASPEPHADAFARSGFAARSCTGAV